MGREQSKRSEPEQSRQDKEQTRRAGLNPVRAQGDRSPRPRGSEQQERRRPDAPAPEEQSPRGEAAT